MEKIVGFPCSKCKQLTDGKIIEKEDKNTFSIIKFKTECCSTELVEYFTKRDLDHYVREVN